MSRNKHLIGRAAALAASTLLLLTLSPLKNAPLINQIGERIGREVGVEYLPSDFKKRGGYLRSIELSKEHGLYRQSYCGCEYSKREGG